MTAEHLKIYLSDPLYHYLRVSPKRLDAVSLSNARGYANRSGKPRISPSTTLNRLAERHLWLVAQLVPDFNAQTWAAVLQAFNGRTEHTLPEALTEKIGDACLDEIGWRWAGNREKDFLELDAMTEKTGVEYRRLVEMTPAQNLAVLELIERFWGNLQNTSVLDQIEQLKGLGTPASPAG